MERRYLGSSAVLETTFTTPTGVVTLTDLMPRSDGRADVVRRLHGVSGTVPMRHEWVIRLDYGDVVPWVQREVICGERVITAIGGPDKLILRGPRLPVAGDHRHVDEFEVSAGDELLFSTTWVPSHVLLDDLGSLEDRIGATTDADDEWLEQCRTDLPHVDVVRRSLLTLRMLTHEDTGGIVAAPTTSLPEEFGGERNWDYRYCWLRDAALTLGSLIEAGYTEEALLWRGWLLRAVAGDPEDLQIMYAVDGARRLPEAVLEHLPGYEGSRPVRIGNAAVQQRQSDVLGEVMIALEHARDAGLEPDDHAWAMQRVLVQNLAKVWRAPDNGLWEIRGPLRHFTHSRAMVWAAFDRAVHAVEQHGLPGPVEEWRRIRAEVRAEVLEHGFDRARNSFTQHYDTTEVDASLLVLSQIGFVDGRRPPDARHHRRRRGGPDPRRAGAALPHGERRGRHRGQRAPVPGLLVLAGLGVRRRRPHRRRARAVRPPRGPRQRRRPALGGVRRRAGPDGRQLPAGVQPPGPGPGGLRARARGGPARRRGPGTVTGAGASVVAPAELLRATS